MLWFPALCQLHPTRAVYLDSTKGAHSFSWTELHRQLALTREESPLKVFFENSPFMYMYIYIYIYIYIYVYIYVTHIFTYILTLSAFCIKRQNLIQIQRDISLKQ